MLGLASSIAVILALKGPAELWHGCAPHPSSPPGGQWHCPSLEGMTKYFFYFMLVFTTLEGIAKCMPKLPNEFLIETLTTDFVIVVETFICI
jgi:hypothetical protein